MQDEDTSHNMSDSVKLGVLIHRMTVLENGVAGIGTKLDNMGNLYPTLMTVDLLLAPLRTKISELEVDKKENEAEKRRTASQFKIALTVAIAGPLLILIILAAWSAR